MPLQDNGAAAWSVAGTGCELVQGRWRHAYYFVMGGSITRATKAFGQSAACSFLATTGVPVARGQTVMSSWSASMRAGPRSRVVLFEEVAMSQDKRKVAVLIGSLRKDSITASSPCDCKLGPSNFTFETS